MITAQKALAWGIVNEVFAPEELMEKTLETAREIAAKGTLGVRYSKDSIANGLNMAKEDGFRYEASLLGCCFQRRTSERHGRIYREAEALFPRQIRSGEWLVVSG